jgi:hypothetical protein
MAASAVAAKLNRRFPTEAEPHVYREITSLGMYVYPRSEQRRLPVACLRSTRMARKRDTNRRGRIPYTASPPEVEDCVMLGR